VGVEKDSAGVKKEKRKDLRFEKGTRIEKNKGGFVFKAERN